MNLSTSVTRITTAAALVLCASLAHAQVQRIGNHAPAQVSRPVPRTVDAPEINPGLVAGMLVLLVGGVLVLSSRRRREATV